MPPHDDHGSRPTCQIPSETYNYLIHALLSLQGSASHPHHPYPSPLAEYHHPWPLGTAPPISTASMAVYPTHAPPLRSSQLTPSSAASPTAAQDPEDVVSTAEEKRRRNTAASARFRIKKKLKTLNLERTVTDLAGRADELEREAVDLRRENAWLKEIVLLKGRSLASLNLGSLAPGSGRDDDDDDDDDEARAHAESEPESTLGAGKG